MKRSALQDVAGENRTVQIGEHIIITAQRVTRFGNRELKPLITQD